MTKLFQLLAVLAVVSMPGPTVHAGIMAIEPGDFSGGETLIDYGPPLITGAPVDGLTISGVLHEFSVGGLSSLDATVSPGGPGDTNSVSPPLIEGDAAGLLSLSFPTPQTRFGFGFAILATSALADGTTIELFDAGSASLGSIAFPALPDPTFPGGFAGIESTEPFTSAEVTFSGDASRFALDDVRFENFVPEPSSLCVWMFFAAGLVGRRSRRGRGHRIEPDSRLVRRAVV